jgi:hypothetical protein
MLYWAAMATSGPSRIFTYEEACRALPAVRERTRVALDELGSIEIPVGDAESEESRREKAQEAASRVLAGWAHDLEILGLEVKGPWLVDFDSGAGYYCWKWPEESLEFFHGYEEGFAGRVRIQ